MAMAKTASLKKINLSSPRRSFSDMVLSSERYAGFEVFLAMYQYCVFME